MKLSARICGFESHLLRQIERPAVNDCRLFFEISPEPINAYQTKLI
ncbi:MAG: hypothetical protein GX222_00620 [Ruminococcaceae bacterium]|nr:hypothetical protein [Oscillospiraceae bacterium]